VRSASFLRFFVARRILARLYQIELMRRLPLVVPHCSLPSFFSKVALPTSIDNVTEKETDKAACGKLGAGPF
jgi:hypothetical protein